MILTAAAPTAGNVVEGPAAPAEQRVMGAMERFRLELGSSAVPDGVLRSVGWVNLVWVGAFLVLNWVCRIPPPLISAVLIELAVAGGLWMGRE